VYVCLLPNNLNKSNLIYTHLTENNMLKLHAYTEVSSGSIGYIVGFYIILAFKHFKGFRNVQIN